MAQPAALGDDHQETPQPHRHRWPRVPRHRAEEDVLPAGLHGGAALVSAQAAGEGGNTSGREPQRHDL